MDYENCKCWKKLVDKLIDECTETIEEEKVANITSFKNGIFSDKIYIKWEQ